MDESRYKGVAELTNRYFETPANTLRHWDMGLRVRGVNKHREQTIKTAGKVVGGIHSRPEYNVDIDHDFPKLNLFPDEIWPSGTNIEQLQSQLHCLFNTDFTRQKWHVSVEDSLVEVALDLGRIHVKSRSIPICELEFELLKGESTALLRLAKMVSKHVPVRLGKASKAQRGYQLAAQSGPAAFAALDFVDLKAEFTPRQAAVQLLEVGLDQWQQLESMILESERQVIELPMLCHRLRSSIQLINNTLVDFDLRASDFEQQFSYLEQKLSFIEPSLGLAMATEQGTGLFAELSMPAAVINTAHLERVELAIPTHISALLGDVIYGQLQLQLVELLMAINRGDIFGNVIESKASLSGLANAALERSWQHTLGLISAKWDELSNDACVAQALECSLLVDVAYGQLYDPVARDRFRAPLLALRASIRSLSALQLLRSCDVNTNTNTNASVDSDLAGKEANLIASIQRHYDPALEHVAYWTAV